MSPIGENDPRLEPAVSAGCPTGRRAPSHVPIPHSHPIGTWSGLPAGTAGPIASAHSHLIETWSPRSPRATRRDGGPRSSSKSSTRLKGERS